MRESIVVRATFLFSKLVRALVQLRGHLGGFFGGTAQRHQSFGKFGDFHVTLWPRLSKRGTNYRALTRRGYDAKSFHRVGGNDFDADDANALLRLARFARTAWTDRRSGNFPEHVVAFDQMAERSVLMIEK